MPRSSCSRMWQWKTRSPGRSSSRTAKRTDSPARTLKESFQARKGSGAPPWSRSWNWTPCGWKGWSMFPSLVTRQILLAPALARWSMHAWSNGRPSMPRSMWFSVKASVSSVAPVVVRAGSAQRLGQRGLGEAGAPGPPGARKGWPHRRRGRRGGACGRRGAARAARVLPRAHQHLGPFAGRQKQALEHAAVSADLTRGSAPRRGRWSTTRG